MSQTNIRLKVNPEILQKLGASDEALWTAAHKDGSDNRVNWEDVADAVTVDASLGVLSAVFQGLRKMFRNRGKTKEELAEEKEAAYINRSCGALSQMLLEYMQAAQEGAVSREALDELINELEEMDGYDQAGKLKIRDNGALQEICGSIAAYTAALKEGGNTQPPQGSEMSATSAFRQIREHLIRQREWIGEGGE